MTDKELRLVWVRDRTRHTPAHRIPTDDAPGTDEPAATVIACPPFLMTGGHALTFRQAAELEALPCLRCFPAASPHGRPQ